MHRLGSYMQSASAIFYEKLDTLERNTDDRHAIPNA